MRNNPAGYRLKKIKSHCCTFIGSNYSKLTVSMPLVNYAFKKAGADCTISFKNQLFIIGGNAWPHKSYDSSEDPGNVSIVVGIDWLLGQIHEEAFTGNG